VPGRRATCAPADRERGRSPLIGFRLAPRDGLHGAGVAEDDGQACLGAEVPEPGPGAAAGAAAATRVAVRGDRLEQRRRSRLPRPGTQDRAGVVQHAEGHGARVQVEPTGTWVWLGGEAPKVASAAARGAPSPSIPCGRRRRGLQSPTVSARALLQLPAAARHGR
jgi:hypothetical protein